MMMPGFNKKENFDASKHLSQNKFYDRLVFYQYLAQSCINLTIFLHFGEYLLRVLHMLGEILGMITTHFLVMQLQLQPS